MKSFVDQPGAPVLSARTRVRRAATPRSRFSRALRRHAGRAREPARAAVDAAGVRQDRHRRGHLQAGHRRRRRRFARRGCGAAFVNADARGYYFTEYEPGGGGGAGHAHAAADARRSASACSATSGAWSAPAATTSAPISIWPRRSRADETPEVTGEIAGHAWATSRTAHRRRRPARRIRGVAAQDVPPGTRRASASTARPATPTTSTACAGTLLRDAERRHRRAEARARTGRGVPRPARVAAADARGAGAAGRGRGRRRRALRSVSGAR